jgi:hypothetical protein
MGSRVDVSRGKWIEPTGDTLQNDLRAIVQDLMRQSVALGKTPRDSGDHKNRRDRVAQLWTRFDPMLAQFRTATTKESKRGTRDALHAKLCEIIRQNESEPAGTAKPSIAWQRSIESVIRWLDSWTG